MRKKWTLVHNFMSKAGIILNIILQDKTRGYSIIWWNR